MVSFRMTLNCLVINITPVRVVCNLGVILDENMTMLDHISSVCQRCYYQIRQIRQVRKSQSAASKLLLVLALVHSRLDYCNSVLHLLPWSRLQLLQSVLNSAVRLIRGLGRFDQITPVLIDLHWLPYTQRISYKNGFAYVQVFERFGLCVSFWSLCWHCCYSGSFWIAIRSLRWSCSAETQDRVRFKVFCCGQYNTIITRSSAPLSRHHYGSAHRVLLPQV